eukprot:TRINITY_DN43097_c0_g1_i1.p1 TRINITY_DN43097_c0_g1~~TRINITY_DN43097_c0_g1_i1.p1  ORF type:complete len:478 (+),score=46.65 TRINITY_DN43097_c0_g1_i1:115-1548(+)
MRTTAGFVSAIIVSGFCLLASAMWRRRRRAQGDLSVLEQSYAAEGSGDALATRKPGLQSRCATRATSAKQPASPFLEEKERRMDAAQCRKVGKWVFNHSWIETGLRCTPQERPACGGPPLRRFGPEDVRKCLRGKRVLFAGDSVLRYATTQLSYSVQTGRVHPPRGRDHVHNLTNNLWHLTTGCRRPAARARAVRGKKVQMVAPKPCPKVRTYGAGGDAAKSLLWEGAYSEWKEYYFDLVKTFGGQLCCDCYRKISGGEGGTGESFLDPDIHVFHVYRENLYFSAPAPQDTELSFTFLKGDFGWMSDGHMEWCPGCPGQMGPNSTDYDYRRRGADVVLDFERSNHSQLDWREFGRRLRREPQPRLYDAAVFSPGHWTGLYQQNKSHVMAVDSAISSAVRPGAPRIYLLRNTHPSYLNMTRWLADSGWRVADAGPWIYELGGHPPGVVYHFLVDSMHLQPWATVELNNMLLSELCPRV